MLARAATGISCLGFTSQRTLLHVLLWQHDLLPCDERSHVF